MKNQDLFNEIDTIIAEKGYGWTMEQRDSMKRLIGKLEQKKSWFYLDGRFIEGLLNKVDTSTCAFEGCYNTSKHYDGHNWWCSDCWDSMEKEVA